MRQQATFLCQRILVSLLSVEFRRFPRVHNFNLLSIAFSKNFTSLEKGITLPATFNDTRMERLVFHPIQYRNGWLAASDRSDMFTQSIKFYTFSKDEWLLLSASFTAKFGLAFILTLENNFSQTFHFQASRKSIGSSKKWYQGFSKQPSV